MKYLKRKKLEITVLYVLFGFGGIWHILGWFQTAMRLLAGPLLISVTLLLFWRVYQASNPALRRRFVWWSFIVFGIGWGIEYLGVTTGVPFGEYAYGPILQPQLLGIPLAIGFAWLVITLSALLIAQQLLEKFDVRDTVRTWLLPVLTATLMLVFDLVMEQAAPALNYWTWFGDSVPWQNYLAWLVLGYLFARLWQVLKINPNTAPTLAGHVYLAQLLYFLLVILQG